MSRTLYNEQLYVLEHLKNAKNKKCVFDVLMILTGMITLRKTFW